MKTKLYYLAVLFFLFFVTTDVNAQAPVWQWVKSATGDGGDNSNKITVDANGNSYITGYSTSTSMTFGSTTLNNDSASWVVFIAKYNMSGQLLWAKGGNAQYGVTGYGITTDDFGNCYATGISYGPTATFDTIVLTSVGNSDIFVVKYDAAGNVLWARRSGGNKDESGMGITADASGNLYVTGYFSSDTFNFGSSTLTSTDTLKANFFIAKYDSAGNEIWAKGGGGSDWDLGRDIITDNNGNVYLTGVSRSDSISFDSYTISNGGGDSANIFIVKYDASGNVLWAKSGLGKDYDSSRGITKDASGNLFISGSFYGDTISFDSFSLANHDTSGISNDLFIVKYDGAGNVIWAKSAGGIAYEYASGVISDQNGCAYITGSFWSQTVDFGTTTLTNSNTNNYDIMIVKYDVNGNVIWAKSTGGYENDESNSIAIDPSGSLYITGPYYSLAVPFGLDTLVNTGTVSSGFYGSDIFTAKLNSTTGIFEEAGNNFMNIYPNPATNILTISLPNHLPANSLITINDMQGRVIKEEKISQSNSTIQVDVNALSQGVYLLRINGQVQRFVKM